MGMTSPLGLRNLINAAIAVPRDFGRRNVTRIKENQDTTLIGRPIFPRLVRAILAAGTPKPMSGADS